MATFMMGSTVPVDIQMGSVLGPSCGTEYLSSDGTALVGRFLPSFSTQVGRFATCHCRESYRVLMLALESLPRTVSGQQHRADGQKVRVSDSRWRTSKSHACRKQALCQTTLCVQM